MKVLEKDLNFAPTIGRIPFEKIIGNVEEVICGNRIPLNDAECLRQDISSILRKAQLPKQNITVEERVALTDLRNDDDILVLKSDKENATVVMDASDYENKILGLLSDTMTYKRTFLIIQQREHNVVL